MSEIAGNTFEDDPEFVASGAKDQLIEDLWRILNEDFADNKAAMAKALSVSRQYLHEILNQTANVNFEIETLAKFAVVYKRRISIRLFRRDEANAILPVSALPQFRSMMAKTRSGAESRSPVKVNSDFRDVQLRNYLSIGTTTLSIGQSFANGPDEILFNCDVLQEEGALPCRK